MLHLIVYMMQSENVIMDYHAIKRKDLDMRTYLERYWGGFQRVGVLALDLGGLP